MNTESQKKNDGALWKNVDKNGKPYLGGHLTDGRFISIFPNQFKRSEKHPDFIVCIAEDGHSNSHASVGVTDPFDL